LVLLLKAATRKKQCKRNELSLNWFDFHLSSFNGVVITFPAIPVHTVSIRGVFPLEIAAIQVGSVTGPVPPGSLVTCGTAAAGRGVVVSIFSTERHAAMAGKRVTSSSYRDTIKQMYGIKTVRTKQLLI